jgi:hypothetical protein
MAITKRLHGGDIGLHGQGAPPTIAAPPARRGIADSNHVWDFIRQENENIATGQILAGNVGHDHVRSFRIAKDDWVKR